MACSYCYARRMYDRFKWNPVIRFEPETLLDLAVVPDGSRVFIGSTMELFHKYTQKWIPYILDCIKRAPWRTSILLTKQPTNLLKFSPFPQNCWVGVSPITNGQLLLAITQLEKIEVRIKFLSIEPMLNELDAFKFAVKDRVIDWVIIGQQTPVSKKSQPKIEWVQEIVEAADKADIPVFLKENLKPILSQEYNKYPSSWAYSQGVLRQEMPK